MKQLRATFGGAGGRWWPGLVLVALTTGSCGPLFDSPDSGGEEDLGPTETPCTTDGECAVGTACREGWCDGGTCRLKDIEGACDDGNPCTLDDRCQQGQCVGDDKECSDGKLCNGVETCHLATGQCGPGQPLDLGDQVACTLDECDEGAGLVSHTPQHSACDDGNVCTADSCDAAMDCIHKEATGACDDGDPCTSGDSCLQGQCLQGTWVCGDPCGTGTLPDWVEPDSKTGDFIAQCDGFELSLGILQDGMVRLRYIGSQSGEGLSYAMQTIQAGSPPKVSFGTDGTEFKICTPLLAVRVFPATCRIEVLDGSGNPLVEDGPDGAYGESTEAIDGAEVVTRHVTRSTPAGERFYGFGEKTGPLDKRGRVMEFWNTDTPAYPTDADPLYQSIPFFIGLRDDTAYGIYLDDSHRARFDMAAGQPEAYSLTSFGGEIDQVVIAGPALRDVIERYTLLTGRMPLPPRWTLGYHQSRWSYYPDDRVIEICQEFRQRGIPADGIWLDIDYMDGFRSWTWDSKGFSDPGGLVSEVGAIGFKVTGIIDPGLKVDPLWEIYQQALEGLFFLLDAAGKPFVGEVWPGPAAYPDFTRPDVREWWGGLAPRLTDHGVRGIWLDMNEPANFQAEAGHTVPGWVGAYGDGQATDMAEIHNVYALLEARATYDGMLKANPDRRPFLLTRAGFAGIQRHAAVWTGDADSTMSALKQTLPMLLGLGLSGVPMVGSDVGGWTGGATPELFARWVEVGAISPFFRGHVQTGAIDQEPWAFGVEVEEISRLVIGDRYRLLPYWYSLLREASQTGIPPLRPMVLEFQDDEAARTLSYQALVGPYLLFAPVLDAGSGSLELYLPEGRWMEFHSGALVDGPAQVQVSTTLQALPVFMREGAIVPRMQPVEWSDQAPISSLQLEVMPGAEPTSFTLYEDDGDSLDYLSGSYSEVTYTAKRTAAGAVLSAGPRAGSWVPPPRRLVVRLRRVDHVPTDVTFSGTSLPKTLTPAAFEGASAGWYYDASDLALLVAFDDQPGFTLVMHYDPTVEELSPPVKAPLQVLVPFDTPPDSTIFVATSASGWAQQPLEWSTVPFAAVGEVEVPRGEWFYYKYTRGDWETVEKWSGCLESANRYAFGKAHPVKEDVVEEWADLCP